MQINFITYVDLILPLQHNQFVVNFSKLEAKQIHFIYNATYI